MYLSTERVAPYPIPTRPDITDIKRRIARRIRKIMIACLGREFMALSARHKIYGLYFIMSFLIVPSLFCEVHPWLMIPFITNLANAVRLVNKIVQKPSARD